jgi:hypothetical protein
MDEFAKITGEIEFCRASVGEKVPGIFVGESDQLKLFIHVIEALVDSIPHSCEVFIFYAMRGHEFKTVLRTIPLRTLGKTTHPVSYQLVGASSTDTLDSEGKVDVFKHTMMPVFVQMFYQLHRVFRVAVVAD